MYGNITNIILEILGWRRYMMDQLLTYISLFSCAGVGCYGFKQNGFHCIATNELNKRRLEVQRHNNKCLRESGYIDGDITLDETKERIYQEIEYWKNVRNIDSVDVLISTPPCQGMSVFNHKKKVNEIERNSLVVESIKMVKEIEPKFFVLENVPAFMKTECYIEDKKSMTIGNAIYKGLNDKYIYYAETLNFVNYGSNSSRTRTLVIGVRRDYAKYISPIELFPKRDKEHTLFEVIGSLPRLSKMGEISKSDIYHSFRAYPEHMRSWISDLKEGQSAFDNTDECRIPYTIKKDGKRVINVNKTGSKYRRQIWGKIAPSIHTRNDQIASQNTIHPTDDRVFSIRELMIMMTIPVDFKWSKHNLEELNAFDEKTKAAYLKKEENNIRSCIGEAVPTNILYIIGKNIKEFLTKTCYTDCEINNIIKDKGLTDINNLICFIKNNSHGKGLDIDISTMSRISELASTSRSDRAAYYTEKEILTIIFQHLPHIDKEEIRVLEPAVGSGNFIPFIVKKYSYAKKLVIDVIDIDAESIRVLKTLTKINRFPKNVVINYHTTDFLQKMFRIHYDLIIGNPPFLSVKPLNLLYNYREKFDDFTATNTATFFMEYALRLSDYVAFILPKNSLCNLDYIAMRNRCKKHRIECILDFGEIGFSGVSIETIFTLINTTRKGGKLLVKSIPQKNEMIQSQKYITDNKLPTWVLYRNPFFDSILDSKSFGVFDVYRDRQITKSKTHKSEAIWVIKSRNIPRDGHLINHIEGYDSYISMDDLIGLGVMQYFDRDDVFLVPNMTYYPRMIRKPKGVITNGSVAIFILKENYHIYDIDIQYIASNEFEQFYRIARNFATRSLNIDSGTIYYFCISK